MLLRVRGMFMEFIIGMLLWLVWVVVFNVVFKGVLKVGFWGVISDVL